MQGKILPVRVGLCGSVANSIISAGTRSTTVREMLSIVFNAVVVEDYPVYPKGRCVLALQ
jgi:hypothetical protein